MNLISVANGNIPKTEEEKQEIIKNAAQKYGEFLTALGFDWQNCPNSNNTPLRVAKSFVHDLISGSYAEPPKITAFPARNYDGIVFEGNIPFQSLCAHHHLNFEGVTHIAYIPTDKVVGLSKMNRIVDFYSRRPQIQEELVLNIHDSISKICEGNIGVAVMISASHTCVSCRGVRHQGACMKTSKLSGAFIDKDAARAEFYQFIADLKS